MKKKLPAVPDSTFTERQGVHYLGLISSQMGIIWREVSNTDLGIDGYLEFVVNGAPIGLVAVQVKSGVSYIESETDSSFIFRAKEKHVRYWLGYRLPVIVVVYDPRSQVAYWHFVQDYFVENDDAPVGGSVPIRFYKANQFQQSIEKLTMIASQPDSTAHAMLALRASRYKVKQELLTSIEMIELYGKRKWLGEWLPLDRSREELLLHSSLGKKGPAWYWFQPGSSRNYLPHLRNALIQPDYLVRSEAISALISALGKEVVKDLRGLLSNIETVIDVARALASINDLSDGDRQQIVIELWRVIDTEDTWSRNTVLELLSLVAVLSDGKHLHEKIVSRYMSLVGHTAQPIVPKLLRTAGFLWKENQAPELRLLAQSQDNKSRALAMAALAQVGRREDLAMIMEYIESEQWPDYEDRRWISKEISRLFTKSDIEMLKKLMNAGYDQRFIAHEAFSVLCLQIDEQSLLDLLNNTNPEIQRYGVIGLIEKGKARLLTEYTSLLNSNSPQLQKVIAIGLTTTGDWNMINQLLQRGDLSEAVGKGLRYVRSQKAYDTMFNLLLQNEDVHTRLTVGESLALTGDEPMLQRIIVWLLENPYGQGTDVILDLAIHLDRRLYCPIKWPAHLKRDFTPLRYSVRRYDD